MSDEAWYADIDITDAAAGADRIRTGQAVAPESWSTLAVDDGVVPDPETYFSYLKQAATTALEEELSAVAGAADRELIHLMRAHDTLVTLDNELRQRVGDALHELDRPLEGDLEADRLREALAGEPTVFRDRFSRLVDIVEDLRREREILAESIAKQANEVVPNLAALAGPMLAARLLVAAGSLEDLARMPSSTVQVLGAENALFAHLRGDAPSPKHGLIFVHPAVRSAPDATRGSIARALAGKLAIAARIDHYRGELEPDLATELEDRLQRIATRGD